MVPFACTKKQNIIYIKHYALSNERSEHLVHHPYSSTWSIGEAKGQTKPFVKSISRLESGLPFVTRSNPDLMITTSKVDLGKDFRPGQDVEHIVKPGKRDFLLILLMARLSTHIRHDPSFFGVNKAGRNRTW